MTNLVFIFADQMRAHSQGHFAVIGGEACRGRWHPLTATEG